MLLRSQSTNAQDFRAFTTILTILGLLLTFSFGHRTCSVRLARILWFSLKMLRIESSFIIIAADLPTLRPVYQLVLGRITNSRDSSGAQRRSSYKLNPAPLGPSSRQRRIPKDQYLTDTIDLVGKKSEDQERILPPGRIRRTLDVSVNHHSEEDDQLGGLQCSTHHFDVERGTQYR